MIGLKLVYVSFLSFYCTYIFPLESMHIQLYEVLPTGTGFISQNTCGILYLLAVVLKGFVLVFCSLIYCQLK